MVLVLAALAAWFAWTLRGDCRKADGRFDPWAAFETYVSLFLMLCMLMSSVAQVLVRYLFSDLVDLPWTEEFGRLALIWAGFWGGAALQRADDHISMTVVFDLLPERAKLAVRLFGDIVTLAVLAPIVWLGWESARNLDIMHAISLGLPLSVFAYPVPVAGALMVLHTVALMVRRLTGRPPVRHLEPAV
ncbi:MAG: TRAP transporter small permease [Alphaproteobacteria bacterium]|nr:TRAP transporter small permease [Alphaproteobacteria bacterium]